MYNGLIILAVLFVLGIVALVFFRRKWSKSASKEKRGMQDRVDQETKEDLRREKKG
jgi:preprotein translocase subunit SecG